MNKKNNPNKRQAAIIKYLSENGKVTTDEIRRILINDENYGKIIPKSTFSEDINFLRSIGYPIVTSYGYISLDKQETDNEVVYHEKLCQSVIRKWIILYNTIFGYSSDEWAYSDLITKTELKSSCSAISRSQFYKDLKALKKEGYIDYDDEMKRSPYRKNEGYIDIDDDDDETKHSPPVFPCGDFLRFVNIDKRKASKMYKLLNNEIGIVFFKELKELLEKYWPEICSSDEFVPEKNDCFRTVSQDAFNMFERFSRLPYKRKCLDITYCCGKNLSDTILYKDFKTMDAIFTQDSKRFFLLGRCVTDNSIRTEHLLSFEHITDIQESDVENNIYHSTNKNADEIFESVMYNENPDKEKIENRYKKAFRTEHEVDIDECL